ncbi:hypothetical protein C1H46_038070 [Malus baccata]|uniref:Uncharacterized protein n=1 Tax=Malus baccata TaxID=106549 RepID=A0A540KQA0_MALBA|nr:hypothetical protein C1H46_038070 [Malus baccata]
MEVDLNFHLVSGHTNWQRGYLREQTNRRKYAVYERSFVLNQYTCIMLALLSLQTET